jgi:mono/diheme cytochrome c family protein
MKTLIVAVVCAEMALLSTRAFSAEKKAGSAKGQAVFQQQCSVCHNADSTEKKMGPGLKGLFKKATLTDGKKISDANVRAKIDQGGNGMPAFKDMLGDDEKNELIAYLKTL